MAYCTVPEVKLYLGTTTSNDDELIKSLIPRAQAAIDSHCARTFEALADTTRYFDAITDVDGITLCLDDDLAAITTITNGDGVAVSSGNYVTEPRNSTPYYAIRLKSSANIAWESDSNGDPENAVSIVGRWAYSTEAPDDIVHACIRLSAFYYRQKDAQVFDTTATPELGVITVPKGIPSDVKRILEPYRRRA